MSEPRQTEDRFTIRADSPLTDERVHVLKRGDTFMVCNALGDIDPAGPKTHGLFSHGMRHLSRISLRIDGIRPLLLNSRISEDNSRLTVDLTNPDMQAGDGRLLHGTLHIARSRWLTTQGCRERMHVTNYGMTALEMELTIAFDADFADIFELRGMKRSQRGRLGEACGRELGVVLEYRGADGVVRRTTLETDPAPTDAGVHHLAVALRLEAAQTRTVDLRIALDTSSRSVL